MRSIALVMLAGLAAIAFTPTASALCADDGNGGCQSMGASSVAFDVRGDCEDSAGGLCLSDDGNASNIVAGHDVHLNVTNHHDAAIDFEVFIIQRVDDAVDDSGEPVRMRADRIALLEDIAAGETRAATFTVDGNASQLRFQALSEDEKHAELDVQAMHVMYMTGLPEDGEGEVIDPVADEDGRSTDADEQADEDADDKGRDAPYLGVVAVLAVLVGLLAFRRD